MKSLFILLPVILAGCSTVQEPRFETACATISISHGNAGHSSYRCEQFSCGGNDAVAFSCQFQNLSHHTQVGPAIKFTLVSKETNDVVYSQIMYGRSMEANEGDKRFTVFSRGLVVPACSYDLSRCDVIIDDVSPKR